MDKKSIIIFGKGPSVLKCTRDIVDSYEDIAIVNYPVLNDFFYPLIKDRVINYHFCNCGSYDSRYTNIVNKKLKIEGIYNTNKSPNIYQKFLKNKNLFKFFDRKKYSDYFFNKYGINPSSGLMCLEYILNTCKYNKICLVGFDGFKRGEQAYYFTPKEYSNEAKRLINLKYKNNVIIKPNGIYNIENLHNPEESKLYIKKCIEKFKEIEFKILEN